jgi:hypothetical protein
LYGKLSRHPPSEKRTIGRAAGRRAENGWQVNAQEAFVQAFSEGQTNQRLTVPFK